MYGYDPMQQIQQALMQQASFDPQTIEADEMTRAGMVGGPRGSSGGGGGGGSNPMGQAMGMGGQALTDTYDIFTNKNEDGSTDFDWDTMSFPTSTPSSSTRRYLASGRQARTRPVRGTISSARQWAAFSASRGGPTVPRLGRARP